MLLSGTYSRVRVARFRRRRMRCEFDLRKTPNRPRNVSIFYTDYLMRAISDENAQRSPPNVRRFSSETGAFPEFLDPHYPYHPRSFLKDSSTFSRTSPGSSRRRTLRRRGTDAMYPASVLTF